MGGGDGVRARSGPFGPEPGDFLSPGLARGHGPEPQRGRVAKSQQPWTRGPEPWLLQPGPVRRVTPARSKLWVLALPNSRGPP